MKIIIIDDETMSYQINEIKKMCQKYNSIVIVFEPKSLERKELYQELKDLCLKENFNIALLDYELWAGGEFLGDELVPILKETNTPFISFSGSPRYNSILNEKGAVMSLLKDRNFNGEQAFCKMLELVG